ncbi:MAG: hypothetical protein K1Y02_20515 [Candidatus Hydrogenedentes bacterium]|nr:hypothetical protein [Candidatus Hydrogenedentota bacterium]
MALIGSVCLNHPGVEAEGRCKQCGKPFCNACKVQGPTGQFCSQECKQKHETFTQRAGALDAQQKKSAGFVATLRKVFNLALALAVIAVVLGIVGSVFEIPVLSNIVFQVRGLIGF